MKILRLAAVSVFGTVALLWPPAAAPPAAASAARPAAGAADLWLAPGAGLVSARADLAQAVSALDADRPAEALLAFETAAGDPVLGGYALLYLGRAQLALERKADALSTARRLLDTSPAGYLAEAALWLTADAADAASDAALAAWALERLIDLPSAAPLPTVQLRLGRALAAARATSAATGIFARIYFEAPLAPEARDARTELARLAPAVLKPSREALGAWLGRGERLFAGGQYTDARAAFAGVKAVAAGADRQLVDLRLAECDYALKRFSTALTALGTYLGRADAPRRAEAEYYLLGALRETRRKADYDSRLKTFVDRGGDPAFVQRALYDLARFHVLANDDAKAAAVFADLYRRFPIGPFAERAAWKAGWWAYRTGDYAETIALFESAAAGMRHADFRPAWLYWAARAHANLAQADAALAGYARTVADYRNTYYGRAATRDLEAIAAARRPAGSGPVSPARLDARPVPEAGARPTNAELVQALLAAEMYDEAVGELRLAQAGGASSPLVDATIAFALNRQGRLRPAITAMRRAYPQFMAAGGEALPMEILTVIFPVDHWDAIQKYAAAMHLDRHLLAALIAQESTFQADIRSAANAWGLMQILPSTGRQYAQRLGIRPFSTNRLIDPNVNLRIGTTFFAELLERFDDVAPALAAYNAGPSRAAQWVAERPGLGREEWVDDIPYPETQNYVKRILGTAEDYRRLYR